MGYLDIQERDTALIRKGLQGSVFRAASSAAAVTAATLFDTDTGDLTGVPATYTDVGVLTDAGAKMARSIKTSDLTGWGYTEPVRSDVSSDTETMVIECQETKLETLGIFRGVEPSSITPDPTNGTVSIPKPSVGNVLTHRILAIAVDETDAGEIAICRFFPNAKVTDIGDQSFANGDSAITYPITFTAYTDSALGFAVLDLIGGAGWLALLGGEDVPRIVTCSTSSSGSGSPPADTVLTLTAGTATEYDVGRHVSGGTIPDGTTITAFMDATHVVISAATTATAAGVAVTIS